jgi:hypothetical protein
MFLTIRNNVIEIVVCEIKNHGILLRVMSEEIKEV